MRKFFLRALCICLFGLCLVGGTLKGVHRSQEITSQVTDLSSTLVAEQSAKYQAQLEDKQSMIDAQAATIERLNKIVSYAIDQEYSAQPFDQMKVTATAYSARKEECNAQPWITASGTPSRVGVVAVSRDLERVGVNLGDIIIIKGMGLFRVEDRMNKRWKNRIDILHANPTAARIFSKREVEILFFNDAKIASQARNDSKPLT